ncbi:MAG: GHKL domain-containing protein [Bacteroidetes bacterium]|nr:GHKL domain-containing protein [Fibrella sp.]
MNYLSDLQKFPVFDAVPIDQLQWLADRLEPVDYATEAVISKVGDPIDHLILVRAGHVYIQNGADAVAEFNQYDMLGVLPFSRLKQVTNPTIARAGTQTLTLHRNHFRELTGYYELTEAFVQRMTSRVRDYTQRIQQEDKLASLGRMSAGLAHELNNPVAAVVRSADALRQHLRATPERFKEVMTIQMPPDQVDLVNRILFEKIAQKPALLSFLERSSLEDDLTDWLDDHGVPPGFDFTEPLVNAGFSTDDLDALIAYTGPENLTPVLGWMVNNLITEKLVVEIADASDRIGSLVGAIKSYTHMDRGTGKTDIQLREGIYSTLTLLNHKLKAKHIAATVSIADGLPVICGWPGELNQVWTNLIDNAVDAMADGGKLEITAELDKRSDTSEFVLTRVVDNGSGIPEAIASKIFDPFFTTKGIGQGTGLGLDIVKGIVKRHNGSISVKSEPGRTEFAVCLPVQ